MTDKKSIGPRCRLCGHNHWSNEEHTFDKEPADGGKQKVKPRPKSGSRRTAVVSKKSNKNTKKRQAGKASQTKKSSQKDIERVQRWRRKNPDKYRQYQRDYMRRKRSGK